MGVGPKVVDAAQRVITALDPRREIFRQASFPQLNTEAVVRAGNVDAVLTRDVIRQIRESAAVLFGSLGMPHLAKELQMILGKKLIIELFRQGFENNVNCPPE
jgi:isocitrate/isopropylmalate dehydrogenase